jgi:hypothetical protein
VKDAANGRKRLIEVRKSGTIICESYKSNPVVLSLLTLMENHLVCCKFLGVDDELTRRLQAVIDSLRNPAEIGTYEDFRLLMKQLAGELEFIDKGLLPRLSKFTCEECLRLDEAIICYINHCYTASVVMAVSAVELRLHRLIERTNKKLYVAHFKSATLGNILRVFDEDEYKDKKFEKIKRLLPAKHKPLVALLNQYRIFSAHPKGEDVTSQMATTVLHLSFAFMLDDSICPYSGDELVCKTGAGSKRSSSRQRKRTKR